MNTTLPIPLTAVLLITLVPLVVAACGPDAPAPHPPQTSSSAGGQGGASVSTVTLSVGSGGNGGEGGGPGICSEQDVTLQLEGVRVMLLLDRSGSMGGTRWNQAKAAINKMLDDPNNADTWFGLDVFPKNTSAVNKCNNTGDAPVELGANKHAEIKAWLADTQNNPVGGDLTPLVHAVESYMLDPTSALHHEGTANYLIVISDGGDTCYDPDATADPDNDFTEEDKLHMLASAVHDLKDVAGIKTIAIGFGGGTAPPELDTIAKNGGSTFDTHIKASNQAALEQAFDEIATAIRPCRFTLQSPDASSSPSKVNFYFDDVVVPRDLTNADGWNWAKSDELEVEFFGATCTQIKDGSVATVSAKFGCPTKVGSDKNICANRDFYLPTPDVAVMVLQDFSGSMKDQPKLSIPTYRWTEATSAITNMLVSDRNNGIEFGLDLFPDTAEGTGNCDIQPYPNIPVGNYNHHMIIDWLSHEVPNGSTPLIKALERYVYNPGRIGEADVSGSLVIVSDGADSCGSFPPSKPTQLEDATKAIVDKFGVKVFAIGFGSGVSAPQLNAIAKNGGTGQTTYSKAADQTELEQVFDMISSAVTSCIFEVPYAGSDVDYDKVNFYMDGDPIPRDTTHMVGWDWTNAVSKTKVEFYGAYCDLLKEGKVTDVLIEFGCETVVPK
jgi:Mg-chelatase subunit ChlD